MPKRKVDDYYNNIGISSEHYDDDDLDEYGRNVNQDESSILDLFKDNVPKSKEGIDKSQPFIPTRASDCPFNPDGRNHEFIKDQNSDVTCKHCGEEVTDYEVKLWGESVATESQKLECPNCGMVNGMWRVDDGSGDDFICVWCDGGTTIERVAELNNLSKTEVMNQVLEDERDPRTHNAWNAGESKANELSPESQCPKCGSYKTILEGKSSLEYGKRRQYTCLNCYNVFQSEHSPKEIRAMYGDHTSPYDRNRWGESKYTIDDESDQNDGEIQKDIESELHGEEKYVRGYEHDWKDKLDTWDGRAVSDNFTTVQPYDPVNPKYECIYCGKEFSWDDTFTHDGSHGTLPSPYEDMGNT